MSAFISAFYIQGGTVNMIVVEFLRGIFWTLGAMIVIKLFRIKFS